MLDISAGYQKLCSVRLLYDLIDKLLLQPYQEIDREYRTGEAPGWRVNAIFILSALCLTIRYYYGKGGHLRYLFPDFAANPANTIFSCAYFGLAAVFIFAVIPYLFVAIVYRGDSGIRYGISLRGAGSYKKIYLALFALMIPLLAIVSGMDSFLRAYPLCKVSIYDTKSIILWEIIYGAQFFSIEFFFRGVLLYILARHFGASAIFIMTLPYVMFHFGKPIPETLASAVAGLILGMLSLYTRSIWGGFLIHTGVAWTMDFAAIFRKMQL